MPPKKQSVWGNLGRYLKGLLDLVNTAGNFATAILAIIGAVVFLDAFFHWQLQRLLHFDPSNPFGWPPIAIEVIFVLVLLTVLYTCIQMVNSIVEFINRLTNRKKDKDKDKDKDRQPPIPAIP